MHSNTTKLAIITATFNSVKHLPAMITCLRAQSNKIFEWVAADGNSTDGTVELLKTCNDLNILWLSECHFDIYDAMKKIIKQSTTNYYLVVGLDDVMGVKNSLHVVVSISHCYAVKTLATVFKALTYQLRAVHA